MPSGVARALNDARRAVRRVTRCRLATATGKTCEGLDEAHHWCASPASRGCGRGTGDLCAPGAGAAAADLCPGADRRLRHSARLRASPVTSSKNSVLVRVIFGSAPEV